MPLLGPISRVDPLVRLLLLAILLASIIPVAEPWRPVAQGVSNAAVFLLFLLNGLRLPRDEVLKGISHVRFLVPLIAWCFGAMTLAGWGLYRLLDGWLPPLVALGMCFLGALPSTIQSATAYSSAAGGNVANSVIAAALLNILGVFITAPLFAALAGGASAGLDLASIEKIGLILLLPFMLGQIAQHRFGHLIREHRSAAAWMDRISIAIAVYVAFSGAVEKGLWNLVGLADWGILLAALIAYLAFGFGGAWLVSGALKLDRRDRASFLFAGGQKSVTMGAPLASVLFPAGAAGLVLLPILAYHLMQLVLSAPLAARLSRS